MRIMFASIILLSIPLMAVGEEQQEEQTSFIAGNLRAPMMNGKAWSKLDPQSKIMYLIGLDDGAILLIAEMTNKQTGKDEAKNAYPALERLTIRGFRFSDIMGEVDRFYEDASNRRIPVVETYRHVLKKFKGSSADELTADQSGFRKKYNK